MGIAALGHADEVHYVSVNPGTVIGGTPSTGVVYLVSPATVSETITLGSSSSSAQIAPSTVVVLAGQTSATFSITTSAVYQPTSVTISATLRSKTVNCGLLLAPTDAVHFISASPGTVVGGSSSLGTVALNLPAPAGGTAVSLTSNNSAVQMPSTVTVPAGSLSQTFTINTSPVYSNTEVNLTASLGISNASCGLGLTPTDGIHYITTSPNTVMGGGTSLGTVFLDSPAPTGGTAVSLSSGSPDAQVPTTVTVPAGSLSQTFTITTAGVIADETVTLSATLGHNTVNCGLRIAESAILRYVNANPGTVVGGNSTTGTVALVGPAPLGGARVSVFASVPQCLPLVLVTIPAGSTSASFNISTTPVAVDTHVTLTASYNGKTVTCGMIVTAPHVATLSVPNISIIGGTNEQATVVLNGPAPEDGVLVTLSSNSSLATLPAAVTIPAGATSANVLLTTKPVTTATSIQLSAISGTYTQTRSITLLPK